MKSVFPILLVILALIIISSCKKKDLIIDVMGSSSSAFSNYSQLKTGNYWIYEIYEIEKNGAERSLNIFDSCYIEKDTIINGKLYYKMFRPNPSPSLRYTFIRDSLHYIVDANGDIKFSSSDFTTVFTTKYHIAGNDTSFKEEYKMVDKDMAVTVPAGTFITSNFRLTYTLMIDLGVEKIRHQHTRYAKDVGIVTETLQIYAGSPNSRERRLVRYHLN